MKQAKFALTAVALLAVIGGALAFKANRTPRQFFSYGTTLVDGVKKTGCVIPVQTLYTTNAAGTTISYYPISTTVAPNNTCTTLAVPFG